MEKTFEEKMLWGNVIEIVKLLEEGLQSNDIELKQLYLEVILGHFSFLTKELNLLPDEVKNAQKFKKTLLQLCHDYL